MLPARAVDLALEDAELVTKGENLDTELGIGVTAEDPDLEEDADDEVGEGAEHDRPTWQEALNSGKGQVAGR